MDPAVVASTAYRTLAMAGCTALDQLQRGASSPALESVDRSASLVDQRPVVLDGLLREGFALLTQPSAPGIRPIVRFRIVRFTDSRLRLPSVVRGLSPLTTGHSTHATHLSTPRLVAFVVRLTFSRLSYWYDRGKIVV